MAAKVLPTTVTKCVFFVSCLDQGASETYYLYNATPPALSVLIAQADALVAARQALMYADAEIKKYRLTLTNTAPTTRRQAYVKNVASPPGKIVTGSPAYSMPFDTALLIRQQATAGTPPVLTHTDKWLHAVPAQNVTSSEAFSQSIGTFAADFASFASLLISSTRMVTLPFTGTVLVATAINEVSIVDMRNRQAGRNFNKWVGRVAS